MEEKLRAEALKCTLEAALSSLEAGGAVLVYTFENGSSQNAYLFNRLWTDIAGDGTFAVDPGTVHVEVAGGGVLLSKKIMPVPENMRVEKRIVPCTTLVKPGARFQETVVLRLPLRPESPYSTIEDKDLAKEPVRRKVWFELAFFLSTPEGDELAETVKTTAGEAKYFDVFPHTSQKLLRVGPFSTELPIRLPK
jgi:hypothetical protein